jgi:hypothetical protein
MHFASTIPADVHQQLIAAAVAAQALRTQRPVWLSVQSAVIVQTTKKALDNQQQLVPHTSCLKQTRRQACCHD